MEKLKIDVCFRTINSLNEMNNEQLELTFCGMSEKAKSSFEQFYFFNYMKKNISQEKKDMLNIDDDYLAAKLKNIIEEYYESENNDEDLLDSVRKWVREINQKADINVIKN